VNPLPRWHSKALCAGSIDPEMWWYEYDRYNHATLEAIYRIAEGIRICNECPVKDLCLTEGLEKENLPWGVRGGLMASERISYIGEEERYRHIMYAERDLRAQVRHTLKTGRINEKQLNKIRKESKGE
jgi:hypothetical protein